MGGARNLELQPFASKVAFGLMPYPTYAETAALEVGQTGELSLSLIADKSWLSNSDLREAGGRVVAGRFRSWPRCRPIARPHGAERHQPPPWSAHRSKGVELELRWICL